LDERTQWAVKVSQENEQVIANFRHLEREKEHLERRLWTRIGRKLGLVD
jgi:hypothetical protein